MASTANASAQTGIAPGSHTDLLPGVWRRSRPGLFAVAFFSIVYNLLRLAVPIYVLQVVDRVVNSRSVETLVMLSAIVLLAIVVAWVLEVVRRKMLDHWGNWLELQLGPALVTSSLNPARGSNAGETSRLMRDVSNIRSFIAGTGFIAWIDLIWAPFFVAAVFLISPLLGFIAMGACFVAFVIGLLNEWATRESREASYFAGRDDKQWIDAAERNRESLGSLNLVSNYASRWSEFAKVRIAEGARTRSAKIYSLASMRAFASVLRVGILGIGVWLIIEQSLTVGAVIAASVLARTAYGIVRDAMNKWRDMIVARRAYGRVKNQLAKESVETVSIPASGGPLPLVIDKVSFRYPGQKKSIIKNLSAVINPGEAVCIIGPSASGKSTLSRLLSGQLVPQSGKIRLGDVDISRMQQHTTRRDVGLLPQDYTIFAGTVRQNIARMADGDMGEVVRAARLAGVHQAILALPNGYDTTISEGEPLLSSGQRKAVALARAVYGVPPLIVMDEPLAELDRFTRNAVREGIIRMKEQGAIVVFSAQTRNLLGLCEKAILLGPERCQVVDDPERLANVRRRGNYFVARPARHASVENVDTAGSEHNETDAGT